MIGKRITPDQKESVRHYLRELTKFSPISSQEVTRHAQEIEKGKNLIYEALIQFSFVRDRLLNTAQSLDEITQKDLFGSLASAKFRNNGKKPREKEPEKILIRQIKSLCRAAERQDPKAGIKLAEINLAPGFLNQLTTEVENRANPLRARLAESERKLGLKEIRPRSLQGWLASRANGNGLSVKKFLELADQIDQGQKLRNPAGKRLAEANLRLPVWVAKRYYSNYLEFLDLVQEGNLGLIMAVEKFNWQQGYRFDTCATLLIRREISQAIYDKDRTIRRPRSQGKKAVKIALVSRRLTQNLGREPYPEEIAEDEEIKWPLRIVKEILNPIEEPTSLDQPITDKGEESGEDGENDTLLHDRIPDQKAANPEMSAWLALSRQAINKILDSGNFTIKEARVIRLYFGFEDGTCYSLPKIGKIMNVSHQTSQKTLERAFLKLMAYQNKLAPYFQALSKD